MKEFAGRKDGWAFGRVFGTALLKFVWRVIFLGRVKCRGARKLNMIVQILEAKDAKPSVKLTEDLKLMLSHSS